jgi:hypothetical protein
MKEAESISQNEWYGDIEDLEKISIDQLGAIIVDKPQACGLR